jgi:chemotaxis protein histidine kinase CheA
VIKSIHGLPCETAGISGGAILADGSVGLIVDVAAVLGTGAHDPQTGSGGGAGSAAALPR